MYRYTQLSKPDSGRGEAFRRDAPTLLCYAALAAYAFWLYAFGPALALLREELHFSYTLLGAYSALWAAGAALVGVTFTALARRLPRAALLWFSVVAATAGAGLSAAVRSVPLTLLGAALLGFAGTAGAWLTRRAGRTVPLLCASLAVTAAGFLLFWLAGQPALAVAGLFLCGLGVANLYPLSLALTLAAAPGSGDSANAATQLLGGVLVVAAPYLLGSLADRVGLHAAFAIEPALIAVCALLLLAGLRGFGSACWPRPRRPGSAGRRPARPGSPARQGRSPRRAR